MKKISLLFALLCVISVNEVAGKTKTEYRNALIFAYSQANSVYEDENIKLEIYNEQLWATNKTKKTIFIDLAQCFAFHNGASTPLFDSSVKKQGDKKASKKGISTKDDEYISIAPSIGAEQNETFIIQMSTRIYGDYTTTETPSNDFTDYDKRLLNIVEELVTESQEADRKGKDYVGTAVRHLTEDESINNIGASVAYSFNKKSEVWTNVSLSTWVSDVIFAPFFIELPQDLKKKEQRGFGVKETLPAIVHVKANTPFEFDTDKSPIIVCDWEGNFKKCTFKLSPTRITKKKGNFLGRFLGGFFTFGATWYIPLSETTYKQIIHFDGTNSDWGKLNYASDIMKTQQDD